MRSRIYIALLISSIFFKNITAQSHLYLDAAQIFSTFKFSSDNTQNNTAPGSGYSTISSTAFGMGYKYVDSSGFLIIAGLGVRKAGSSLIYNKINYTWNLQYLDLKAGVGYQYNEWRIQPYISVSPFFATLLNARQTIGLNYYDIKTSNGIKNNDYGLFLTAGFNVPLSRFMSIYVDCNYILGLKNIETTESQYLYNRGSAFKLGLLFNLPSKTKDTLWHNKVTSTNSRLKQNVDSAIVVKYKKNDSIQDTIPAHKAIENDTLVLNGNSEKLNEKQLQDISKIALEQNILFKVQLAAVKNELNSNHPMLQGLTTPVNQEKSEDGLIRYYSGAFKTYEKALVELNKIKTNGIAHDAFIVAFLNGKKITINDAKKLLK